MIDSKGHTLPPAEPAVKQVLITALLLSILASCRILCATAECGHAHEWQSGTDLPREESPHPVNDDQCLCNGGLQADDSGPLLSSLDPDRQRLGFEPPGLPMPAPTPAHPPTPSAASLSRHPAHPTSSGFCARLQRFRC